MSQSSVSLHHFSLVFISPLVQSANSTKHQWGNVPHQLYNGILYQRNPVAFSINSWIIIVQIIWQCPDARHSCQKFSTGYHTVRNILAFLLLSGENKAFVNLLIRPSGNTANTGQNERQIILWDIPYIHGELTFHATPTARKCKMKMKI